MEPVSDTPRLMDAYEPTGVLYKLPKHAWMKHGFLTVRNPCVPGAGVAERLDVPVWRAQGREGRGPHVARDEQARRHRAYQEAQ
jgi:hypothetical protein